MGFDDEYRAVATGDDGQDQLLNEKSQPITRSQYKKRLALASLLVGTLIGASVGYVGISIFGPSDNHTVSADVATTTDAAAAVVEAPTVTVTATVEVTATPTNDPFASNDPFAPSDANTSTEETHEDRIDDCGSTPDEARSKGCVFDVMMQLWMPPACYDEPLSERYLLSGNWTWWADAEASRTLSLEEMRKGEHPVIYVIQDYHKQHCIFAWEKVVRALRNNEPVIEELISYDHVMHCKHTTLSKDSDNVLGVRAPTAYARCALYDTWTRHLPANAVSTTD